MAADAQSRLYGDANPLLTYRIGGAGLVNGDTLSGGLATTAAATSNVGTYAITQGTLANTNYSIAYTGADLTVTARPVAVASDTESKPANAAGPALPPIEAFGSYVAPLVTTREASSQPSLSFETTCTEFDIFGLPRSGYTGCSHRPAIAGSVPELDPQATTFRSARTIIIGPQRSPAACAGVAKAGQAIITSGCNAVKTCRISLVIIRINQSLP